MPKTFAEIVIEGELATEAEVEAAAKASDSSGRPLVVELLAAKEVDELDLVKALHKALRVPVTDPAEVVPDTDALRELAQDVCKRLRVIPLSVTLPDSGPRVMRVAMADASDQVALAEVVHQTGCNVEPSIMTLSAIDELVENSYRQLVTEVIKRGKGGKNKFDGDLAVKTTPMSDTEVIPPGTVPHTRISDTAEVGTRLDALIDLLCENKLISRDEFEEQVRELLKQRDDQG